MMREARLKGFCLGLKGGADVNNDATERKDAKN